LISPRKSWRDALSALWTPSSPHLRMRTPSVHPQNWASAWGSLTHRERPTLSQLHQHWGVVAGRLAFAFLARGIQAEGIEAGCNHGSVSGWSGRIHVEMNEDALDGRDWFVPSSSPSLSNIDRRNDFGAHAVGT
jgi:hypothetical protein